MVAAAAPGRRTGLRGSPPRLPAGTDRPPRSRRPGRSADRRLSASPGAADRARRQRPARVLRRPDALPARPGWTTSPEWVLRDRLRDEPLDLAGRDEDRLAVS